MEELYDLINDLFRKTGLGEITGDITPVFGGLMHKMVKVCSSSGTYAVKCLNPEIMKRPGVFENYSVAETLEEKLESRGIPVVPALSFGEKKMVEIAGRYFYVFRWQEGNITDPENTTKEQCYIAGSILGRIHAIDPKDVEPEEPEICNIDFRAYAEEAEKRKSNISTLLNESLFLLDEAQNKLNEARKKLPYLNAIDDPDMDPKNIMWNEGRAYVIDLECLERGNPVCTCLDLSLQWAGTVNGKYKRENLKAFFDGYLKEYDNGFRSYAEIYGIAYTWVEWLEYNIRRALGMEGSGDEDVRLVEEEVKNTIERIRYLNSIEEDVYNRMIGYFQN